MPVYRPKGRSKNKQPQQGARIARANPITRGLVFAAYPKGGVFYDAVSGTIASPVGTAPVPATGPDGRNNLFAGGSSGNGVSFGTHPRTDRLDMDGGTWFFWANPTSSNAGYAERNDFNTVNAGWLISLFGSQVYLNKEYSSTNMVVTSTATVPLNQYGSIAVTFDGVSSAGVAQYINGVASGVTINAAGGGSVGATTAQNLYLGQTRFGGAGSSTFPGNMELALFFNRVLSPAEIASLHRDRYQVFEQARSLTAPTVAVLPGHRYWRINVTAAGRSLTNAAEISMRTTSGGANVCTGGTAMSSSNFSGGFLPALALDLDSTTMWHSASGLPQWWGYDFGSGNNKDIVEFTWRARNDTFSDDAPHAGALQWSDDNSTWTDALTFSGLATWTASETRTFTITAAAGARPVVFVAT